MKKTLMALALTLVAGSMIACGEAPPAANNANTMNKPTTAPVNKPTEMPAANSNSMPAANSNKPMPANSNAK
ncbi:MAG: hypothetical protein IPF82_12995 [Blastocatellia bacterium]|jgi:hypothetical protein|nr:hypothetical protein [Blastocatellia bacterium]